jgi:Ser/Thr protein kinase RdoA (MazF antagonist)
VTHLPVASSVLAADSLQAEVARRYDLGGHPRCALLAHTRNDSYLVEAPVGAFVLRVYGAGSRSEPEVRYEVDLLAHLGVHGAPVALPVSTRSGDVVWAAEAPEGERSCVLFEHAPGAAPGDPHPSAAFGRAVAVVHTALDTFVSPHPRPPLDVARLVSRPVAVFRDFLTSRPDAVGYLDLVAEWLERRLVAVAPELDRGAVHGDVHGGQGHVAPDGAVILFDFDDCGPGWRAWDLAGFRWWQHFNGRPAATWDAFLVGYRDHRRLGEADLAALPLLVAARHLWLLGLTARSAERFGRWWADDRFVDRRLAQLAGWLADSEDAAPPPHWSCLLPDRTAAGT